MTCFRDAFWTTSDKGAIELCIWCFASETEIFGTKFCFSLDTFFVYFRETLVMLA